MRIEEIRERVAEVEAEKLDYERAHAREDRLHYDFIVFVSKCNLPELAALAVEVLKTQDIDFPRYCA